MGNSGALRPRVGMFTGNFLTICPKGLSSLPMGKGRGRETHGWIVTSDQHGIRCITLRHATVTIGMGPATIKSRIGWRPMAHNFATVADIPEDWLLVSDSQDVASISVYLGVDVGAEFGCLFIESADGDYGAIWGCGSFVPRLSAPVFDVDAYLETWRIKRC